MDNQFAEIDKAVAGIGDYEVHDDYKKICFTSAKWFTISEDQRQRALKRFQSALTTQRENIITQKDGGTASSMSFATQYTQGDKNQYSRGDENNYEERSSDNQAKDNLIAELSIPRYIADTVWQCAIELLHQDSNFVLAPGNGGKAWLVILGLVAVKIQSHALYKVTRGITNVRQTVSST